MGGAREGSGDYGRDFVSRWNVKNHVKPVVAYLQRLHSVLGDDGYLATKARDRRQLHSASFAPVLNVLFELATEVLF